MKKVYHQLTQDQRYKLESYLEVGKSQSEISVLLGFHKSTISREIARNVQKGVLVQKSIMRTMHKQKQT